MQSNEKMINDKKIIKNELWNNLIYSIQNESREFNNKRISDISIEYNIEKNNVLKNFLNYIIRSKKQYISRKFLLFVENIMHMTECKQDYLLNYSIIKLNKLLV